MANAARKIETPPKKPAWEKKIRDTLIECKGVAEGAISLLSDDPELVEDPAFLQMLVDRFLPLVVTEIRSAMRAEAATRPVQNHDKARTLGFSAVVLGHTAAVTNGLLDRPIMGGKRLRSAAYGDLVTASRYYHERAKQTVSTAFEWESFARFLTEVSGHLKGGKRVEEVFTEDQLATLSERTRVYPSETELRV